MTGELRSAYQERYEVVLRGLAAAVEAHLMEYLEGVPRIDRVQARAKSVDRFVSKAAKQNSEGLKYSDPLSQIQDQVGARIVTFYLDDVLYISDIIERYFRKIEQRTLVPESESEFGYFGTHYVLVVPEDVKNADWDRNLVPEFFELQIKTLFQHAWSEANHDLGYKPGGRVLSTDDKRLMAFASAQAWGADRVFNDLFAECKRP